MRLEHSSGPLDQLYDRSLDDLGPDMRLTYRCVKQIPDERGAVVKREEGGFQVLKPMTPIYFADEHWCKAAHDRATDKILQDALIFNTEDWRKNANNDEFNDGADSGDGE